LPKFTGASTIGNSNITDSGSLIQLLSNTQLQGKLYYTYDWLQEKNFGYSSGWKTLAIGSLTSANNFSLAFGVDVSGNPSGSFTGNGNEYFWRNTGSFKTPNAINNGYNQLFEWNSSGGMTFNQAAEFIGTVTVGSPLSIKSTTPYIQWINASSTRLAYIQHNATNLVYNADTGVHVFNQTVTTTDNLYVRSSAYPTAYLSSLRSNSSAVGILQLGNNNDNYILAGNTNTGGYLIFRVNCTTESITSGTEALRLNANTSASFSSRVNVNGAADDGDVSLQSLAPSGAGKYIFVGRDSSSQWRFSVSSSGDTQIGIPQAGASYKLLTLSSNGNDLDNGTVLRLIGNSALDLVDISVRDTTTRIYHQENTADALNGYGKIQFRTNATANGSFPTRGGFQFTIGSTDALFIASTGTATFSNLAGTGTRMVVADANGLLSTQAIGSGAITGSGTTNYLPKFTGASTIGNSIVSESGTIISILGTLNIRPSAGTSLIDLLSAGAGSKNYQLTSQIIGVSNTGFAIRNVTDSRNELIIDGSGNLGLGVTPSAWQSGTKALQINGGSMYAANTYTFVGSNIVYTDAGDKYINTGFATVYGQLSGEHRWYTAPSGTAGNTISLTQAMTLDASGNLGLNTTNFGASKFQVNGSAAIGYPTSTTAPANGLAVNGSGRFGNGTLNGAYFIVKGVNGVPATSGTTTQAVLRLSSGTGLYNVLDFGTNESLDYSWIQSTRANSLGTYDYLAIQPNGGNLLVGTNTNSTFKLDVNGTGRFNGALTFAANVWNTSGGNNRFYFDNANTYFGSPSFWVFQNNSGSNVVSITSAGAATFSSTVNANSTSAALQVYGYQVGKYSYFGYSSGYPGVIIGSSGFQSLFFNVDVSSNPSGAFSGNGSEYVWRNAGSFITPNSINNGYNTLLGWNSSGQVSIPGATTIGSLTTASLQIGDYTGSPTLTFAATSNGISKINFYDSNSTEGLYLRTDGETNGGTMTFGARWDDDEAKIVFKMYQVSAGASYNVRVGIGTGAINPLSMLHVCETDGGNFTGSLRVGGASGFGIVSEYTQSAATTGTMYVSPGYTSNDTLFKLGAASGNTNQLVLRGNGRVGIITDAPFSLLHVGSRPGAGTTNPSLGSIATISNDGLTGIDLGANQNANNVVGHINWINGLGVANHNTARIDVYADGATNSGSLRFWTASASSSPTIRLTIASTGAATFSSSVTATTGIFSISAGNPLQVYQTAATNSTTATIRQTGAGGNGNNDIGLVVDIQAATDTDRIVNFRYFDGTNYNSRFTVQRGGNVGIGTTAPNSLLEVNRTITFSSIDTYAQLVVKTTSGANGKLLNIGVDETNSVSFIQSLNRGTDAMPLSLQRYGGNVGIGTTNVPGRLTAKYSSYSSGVTPLYIGNTGFTNWNRQAYDTFVLQQDDVTSFRMVEKNGETTGSDQVLSFSIGDGNARIATSAQPLDFYVNGSPSGLAYQGLSGTAVLRMNTNGNAQFYQSVDVGGSISTGGSIVSTVGGTSELRLRGGGYGGSYNTSLRSLAGAVGVLQFGNNADNYILVGNTVAGGYLDIRVNCASESVSAGSLALRIGANTAATFYSSVTATAFFESSDRRLKSNILDLDVNVSSIIAKTYLKNGVEEIGYLAQDVESILPSAISKRDDGYLDLSYRQVHTAKIAYLEKRITELEQQLKNK
jgi:hypothetical protein